MTSPSEVTAADVAAFAERCDTRLAPWQIDLVERLLSADGSPLVMMPRIPRRPHLLAELFEVAATRRT